MTYNHGIINEGSDYRVHVCFGEQHMYIFKTIDGKAACESGKYRLVNARQRGVDFVTATGYIVPPMEITGCKRGKIPDFIIDHLQPNKDDDTSINGRKAEDCVMMMINNEKMRIPSIAYKVTDKQMQLSGVDILVQAKIEVKCDFLGGVDGTGNLFLQISESNPLGRH